MIEAQRNRRSEMTGEVEGFVVTARRPGSPTQFPARYLRASGTWAEGIEQARRFSSRDELYDISVPAPDASILSVSYAHLNREWIETWKLAEAHRHEQTATQ